MLKFVFLICLEMSKMLALLPTKLELAFHITRKYFILEWIMLG